MYAPTGTRSLHGENGTRPILQHSVFKNTVLKALDEETLARLHLQPVSFPLNHEIEFPGNAIDHVYFCGGRHGLDDHDV